MWDRVKKKWPLIVLVLLFVVSVAIRAGAFSAQPVSTYSRTWDRFTNDEVYLHTGYVFSVYDTTSSSVHRWAGYVGKSPHFLRRKGQQNLYVYSSFSPALFVVPYWTFKLLHAPDTMLSLDIFNLALQLITTILIFFLILAILPPQDKRRRELMALLGASVYIFSTTTLHNHIDVYWAHQLLQPFLLGALLLFVKRRGLFKWWEAAIVGFVLAVIAWTGLFVVLGMVLYSLYAWRKTKDKNHLRVVLALCGGALAGVALIVLQGVLVTGADVWTYISTIFNRAETRTINSGESKPLLIRWFINGLFEDCGAYLVMAYSMLCAYRHKIKANFAWAVVAISAVPTLESAILLEHDTVYTFGRLKWVLPVILTLSLLGYEFLNGRNKAKRRLILIGLFVVAAAFHMWLYFSMYGSTY